MGETDEFVLQSLPVEDEMVHEPAAEEPVELGTEEPVVLMPEKPAEPIIEQPASVPDETPDTPAETDELDEITQSLSGEGAPDEVTDSFDDIVAPVPAAAAVAQEQPPAAAGQVPWWPFLVYLGAWIVLAAIAVWQLIQLPVDQAVYESPAYAMTILGGLIMTAMGPLLILAVWLGTRANRSAQEREGLLTSALMKGALVTLSGAIIWWASLVIIDYLRLGRLL